VPGERSERPAAPPETRELENLMATTETSTEIDLPAGLAVTADPPGIIHVASGKRLPIDVPHPDLLGVAAAELVGDACRVVNARTYGGSEQGDDDEGDWT
jgi:hypothetical protein